MPEPMTPEEKTRRQKKTKSVRHLAEQIHTLRAKVSKDLKSDDEKVRMTALAVALIDKTAERVGNDASAKDGHFGVTGWQGQHVAVSGDKVILKYVAKSGVEQDKSFTDKTLAKMVKECKSRCKDKDCLLCTPDGFRIRADGVNRYLKEFDITAKDMRGYAANSLMVKLLKGKASPDKDERKKKFQEVIKEVAARVGHQAATLRKHYLLPGLEADYVGKGKAPDVKKASVDGFSRFSSVVSRVAVVECVAQKYIEDERKGKLAAECVREMMPRVLAAYEEVMGYPPENPLPVMIGVNDWDLPEGKVGSLKFPNEDGMPAILTASPSAFDAGATYWWVVTHELIHVLLGRTVENGMHGDDFVQIATKLWMPEEYMD